MDSEDYKMNITMLTLLLTVILLLVFVLGLVCWNRKLIFNSKATKVYSHEATFTNSIDELSLPLPVHAKPSVVDMPYESTLVESKVNAIQNIPSDDTYITWIAPQSRKLSLTHIEKVFGKRHSSLKVKGRKPLEIETQELVAYPTYSVVTENFDTFDRQKDNYLYYSPNSSKLVQTSIVIDTNYKTPVVDSPAHSDVTLGRNTPSPNLMRPQPIRPTSNYIPSDHLSPASIQRYSKPDTLAEIQHQTNLFEQESVVSDFDDQQLVIQYSHIMNGLNDLQQPRNSYATLLNAIADPPEDKTMVETEDNMELSEIISQSENPISKVIYNYNPQMEDEIKMNIGDDVLIEMICSDGWAIGVNLSTQERGAFPTQCFGMVEEECY